MEYVAFSVAIIILLGLLFNRIFSKIKLPGILGMLILGIIIGPHGLDLISKSIMEISPDLRVIALIIILLRAGFGINLESLRKVGMTAVKMSCIPDITEGFAVMLAAHYLLGLPLVEAGILGFVIAAVSPAVIVPQMLSFIERRMGTAKGIPTIILTGASVDDVVSITLFSVFLGIYQGQQVNLLVEAIGVPLSILIGIVSGLAMGLSLVYLFRRFSIRNSEKTLIILGAAILLKNAGDIISAYIPVAALIGVMVVGLVILERMPDTGMQLSKKFNKVWIFAEILLFVLVGGQVDIRLIIQLGFAGLAVIVLGLAARSIGVLMSLKGSDLNLGEKIFCVAAYIPKATVQAAVGAIPLAAGVAAGETILAMAVLAIIFTAPLGAMATRVAGEKFLTVDEDYERP
ncbi:MULTISPECIES: cation:proton antiporter [Methanothermobacter]|uniref:Sodium:proton antiporter n=2 Tax=Methanothermobacter wolfeii TaxID=145261 RepID=A0A9E7RSG1_METWO|nr:MULTISPECIES: sodium:proton antiporter [Methanothermobacter]MDI6702974.1 sodium:proton antiporter [Methanothermobacter wolfeii]MDI6842155.1 sodium:proton antiporter [Methanothermobacter wolfeii]QHN06536.1 sodium:proton antiporter [Methanothermobacter sp. THM-1]UXH31066.1 sodium:proton antiporter [Methanothermobacter wolfeii]